MFTTAALSLAATTEKSRGFDAPLGSVSAGSTEIVSGSRGVLAGLAMALRTSPAGRDPAATRPSTNATTAVSPTRRSSCLFIASLDFHYKGQKLRLIELLHPERLRLLQLGAGIGAHDYRRGL